MVPGDSGDPLLRQVLPLDAEFQAAPGYGTDPVGDGAAMTVPGVLHKYHGRVLLTATGACAVHCRYCFRRHFPYNEAQAAAAHWQAALDYIRADASIAEVILSGGDPLSLSDRRLQEFVVQLDDIAHVRRLRVHTRVPVVIPARVDSALCAWLRATRLATVIVVHVNHANEIDAAVVAAFAALAAAGARLFNQSVLLHGVNDDVTALAALSERLFAAGVTPYYLHVLDKVAGAAHFAVAPAQAQALHRDLAARLPGYLVPRLVREDAGAAAKTWL